MYRHITPWWQALHVLFLTAAAVLPATGTTYYVSTTGSDTTGTGSSVRPWRTINRGDVLGVLKPGDTVLVQAGAYPVDIRGIELANCSGAAGSPITYKANGRVLIDQSALDIATPGYSFGCLLRGNANYTVIDGFEFKGCQWGVYMDGDGGNVFVHDNEVRNCVIYDSRPPRPADTYWNGWCGGVYTSGTHGALIHHNTMYNIGDPSISNWAACVMIPISQYIQVYNNTFDRAWAGVHTWAGGTAHVIRNNIVTNMRAYGISYDNVAIGTIHSHNLFHGNAANYGPLVDAGAAGEFVANPLYANWTGFDYHLQSTSPAIDAGTYVGLAFTGLGPDLGALETTPGVTVMDQPSVGQLKSLTPGTAISLNVPQIATTASGNFADGSFYIEDPNRCAGIRVVPPAGAASVGVGDALTLLGKTAVSDAGEMLIRATTITSQAPGATLAPLGVSSKTVVGAAGLDMAGLLVTIWGKIGYVSPDHSYFYVSDGSGDDGTGNPGVRVSLDGLATAVPIQPEPGTFVRISGVAGKRLVSGRSVNVVQPRDAQDLKDVIPTSNPEFEMATAEAWADSCLVTGSASLPFSFIYNGQSSTAFLSNWMQSSNSVTLDSERVQRTLTFYDRTTKLQVRCVATIYSDYPAVDWVLYFKNTGTADTPIIENIRSLNSGFTCGSSANATLYYADGSTSVSADFRPRQAAVGVGSALSFATRAGRSSDPIYPFFNLAAPDGNGVVLGIGWSGQWAATFNRSSSANINMQAGMELTHFRLHPGEEVRSPSTLLLFWSGGDRMRGQNQLRRVLLDHYSPTPGGQQVQPPIAAGPPLDLNATTEANQILCINNIGSHSVPFDTYWIDAGWFVNGWPNVGTWDPDPAKYPNGMKPVADAAHYWGYDFLLWFEPERAVAGTWPTVNHPEWVYGGAGGGVYNFGDPAALAWMKTKIGDMIADVGIDVYRHDFNIEPLWYWRNADASDRQGINEIYYITGLYSFFDYLIARFPNILIDNCASGGRRIDLEMMKRSIPLWRSDYCWDWASEQCMQYGLSLWYPLHGRGSTALSPYEFRSGMGMTEVVVVDWYNTPSIFSQATSVINQYKSIRNLMLGDFYPLTPYTLDASAWMAWQYHKPETGEGLIQAFRRPGSSSSLLLLKPVALDPAAFYTVTDLDTGWNATRTGDQWMRYGLSVSIYSRPGASIYKYVRE